MNIYKNLNYAFSDNNKKILSPEEVPFLREEYVRGINNEVYLMPSGIDIGWSPLVALMYDNKPVGYIHFEMSLPYTESEFLEDYECNFSFHLKYIYIKEEFRGEGLFSQFIYDFLEELIEELTSSIHELDFDTGYFTYSAEYVTDAGKYIGEIISEELERFSEKNILNYEENIN